MFLLIWKTLCTILKKNLLYVGFSSFFGCLWFFFFPETYVLWIKESWWIVLCVCCFKECFAPSFWWSMANEPSCEEGVTLADLEICFHHLSSGLWHIWTWISWLNMRLVFWIQCMCYANIWKLYYWSFWHFCLFVCLELHSS